MHDRKARAKRACWTEEWQERGFRLYLIADDRIVRVLSWHQVHTDEEAANALRRVKAAGVINEEGVRKIQPGA